MPRPTACQRWKRDALTHASAPERVGPIQPGKAREISVSGEPLAVMLNGKGGMPGVRHQLAPCRQILAKISKNRPITRSRTQNHSIGAPAQAFAEFECRTDRGWLPVYLGIRDDAHKSGQNSLGEAKIGRPLRHPPHQIGVGSMLNGFRAMRIDQDVDIAKFQGTRLP